MMMIIIRAFRSFTPLLALMLTLEAYGATFPVDDSASQPVEAVTPMRWRSLAPTRGDDHVIEGAVQVNIRLATQAWIGKTGRIYMTLAQQPIGQVDVEWATQGKLLPGKLRSGQRGLVYAGKISVAKMEDLMAVTVRSDGRLLSAPQRLRFAFEIDVE
jgi:hypothetical protein